MRKKLLGLLCLPLLLAATALADVRFGGNIEGDVYLGSQQIERMYLGGTVVYGSEPPELYAVSDALTNRLYVYNTQTNSWDVSGNTLGANMNGSFGVARNDQGEWLGIGNVGGTSGVYRWTGTGVGTTLVALLPSACTPNCVGLKLNSAGRSVVTHLGGTSVYVNTSGNSWSTDATLSSQNDGASGITINDGGNYVVSDRNDDELYVRSGTAWTTISGPSGAQIEGVDVDSEGRYVVVDAGSPQRIWRRTGTTWAVVTNIPSGMSLPFGLEVYTDFQ